jgi:hypothetical protein
MENLIEKGLNAISIDNIYNYKIRRIIYYYNQQTKNSKQQIPKMNVINNLNLSEKIIKILMLLLLMKPGISVSQVVSPNGFSGIGVVPLTSVISKGTSTVSFDPTLPGSLNTKGYNTQIGLGIYDGLELVGRLATNDQRCNMFQAGACPANTIRDFSASLKWSLPIEWLQQNNAQLALGVTDVGGAASYFKSYYAVAAKELGPLEVSIGQGKGMANYALLDGIFGGLTYRPSNWLDLNVQKVGSNSWAVATLKSDIPYTQASGYITLNQRLTDAPVTEKQWVGVGVSMLLDGTTRQKKDRQQNTSSQAQSHKSIANLRPEDLPGLLQMNGFYKPLISESQKPLKVEIENTAYAWNTVDAVGVALGVLAATHGNVAGQTFELNVTSRGISQAVVTGDVPCLKSWLETGEVCGSLSIRSGLQRAGNKAGLGEINISQVLGLAKWSFRPELVISPTLVSSIGTEFGSFDIDGGANINLVLPLWTGATLETNQVKPLGISTRGFERGGVFYASRLKSVTSRTMLHQLVNVPSINTQARLSLGTAYATWDGHQLETGTQSDNGRHRLGLAIGNFKNNSLPENSHKKYDLATYRYAHDDRMSTVTELTTGKFWGGDKGWSIGQRFWHGDTALNIYLRRTRMAESAPLVSFAGLQLSIPITLRVNKGMQHSALRGTNQWTYTLESRVLDRENLLTGGYGEVPRIGDSLVQTFNRDRNSTRYLESSLMRAKSAFNELSAD